MKLQFIILVCLVTLAASAAVGNRGQAGKRKGLHKNKGKGKGHHGKGGKGRQVIASEKKLIDDAIAIRNRAKAAYKGIVTKIDKMSVNDYKIKGGIVNEVKGAAAKLSEALEPNGKISVALAKGENRVLDLIEEHGAEYGIGRQNASDWMSIARSWWSDKKETLENTRNEVKANATALKNKLTRKEKHWRNRSVANIVAVSKQKAKKFINKNKFLKDNLFTKGNQGLKKEIFTFMDDAVKTAKKQTAESKLFSQKLSNIENMGRRVSSKYVREQLNERGLNRTGIIKAINTNVHTVKKSINKKNIDAKVEKAKNIGTDLVEEGKSVASDMGFVAAGPPSTEDSFDDFM